MGKLHLFTSAVVWQPGDNKVVERPVAERRVCVIRGVSWSRLCWALLEHCECTLRVLGITHIYVYLYLYVYKGRNKKKRSIFCDVPAAERQIRPLRFAQSVCRGCLGVLAPTVASRGRSQRASGDQRDVQHHLLQQGRCASDTLAHDVRRETTPTHSPG